MLRTFFIYVAMALGPVAMAAPPLITWGHLRFKRTALLTRGVVIELEYRSPAPDITRQVQKIRFQVPDGREFVLEEEGGKMAVGDVVDVLYDPADPRRAMLPFEKRWLVTGCVLMMGLGAFVTWLVFFVWQPLSQ
ncbi:DUF3592 domain-containing protein [Spirillospora albida]|uniref:DUF3592 domain-containing protein n=1 Tax=Spirillospora albida TaxID=58123 RepID=UPI0004C0A19B|nr:DUF3592 domain-containing protein [Spirillospora albida]